MAAGEYLPPNVGSSATTVPSHRLYVMESQQQRQQQ